MNSLKLSSKVFWSQDYITIYNISGRIKVPTRSHSVAGNSPGSGAGKGGGAGGAIREGGGGLGKLGAAREDGYFYDKQKEQLQKLKSDAKLKKLIEEEAPERRKE